MIEYHASPFPKVLALTSKGTVYRSQDKGRSWTKSSEVFHRKALAEIDDQDQQKVGIAAM